MWRFWLKYWQKKESLCKHNDTDWALLRFQANRSSGTYEYNVCMKNCVLQCLRYPTIPCRCLKQINSYLYQLMPLFLVRNKHWSWIIDLTRLKLFFFFDCLQFWTQMSSHTFHIKTQIWRFWSRVNTHTEITGDAQVKRTRERRRKAHGVKQIHAAVQTR